LTEESMRFSGKSIIVTGAGSGIGRAAALLFAAEGGSVLCADITEAVEETAAMIVAAGGTAHAIRIDAGNEEDVIRAVNVASEYYGGLDVMFANAGISGGMANIFDTDVALITEVLRVNLIGPYLAIKHAARGRDPLRRGVARLLRVQGGGDQPGDGFRTAAFRIERARQRDLSGPHRDGHDQADLRLCALGRQDGPGRAAQPVAPWRAAGGTGQGRCVSSVGRCELC
jgi:NAD(P)-dependent dehydrogenase (short-subunit alcohol dehydrogenase family)